MPKRETTIVWTQVDSQGRVVIPIEIRRQLELGPGTRIAFVMEGDRVGLMTVSQGIRRAQETAVKYARKVSGRSIVDEFIAERRAEAARE